MTSFGPLPAHPLTAQGTVLGGHWKTGVEGKTTASVIAAVLERDPPPVSTVQPASPPALDRVVKTCLAKDPDERFQNVHDVKLQLKWIAEGGSQAGALVRVATRRKNREKLAWLLMCGFAILAAAFAVWAYAHPPGLGAGPVLAFVPPPDTRFLAFGFGSGPAVVSPDETKLAFTVIDQSGSIKLWTRSLKANDVTAVPGTEGAASPFWSADGRSLGFFAGGKLKTVELNGGNLQTVATVLGWNSGMGRGLHHTVPASVEFATFPCSRGWRTGRAERTLLITEPVVRGWRLMFARNRESDGQSGSASDLQKEIRSLETTRPSTATPAEGPRIAGSVM